MYKFNTFEYKIIKNYKDAFNEEEVREKFTDYFDSYDYILGDIAYSKLRLKGFYNKENKKCNKINNYDDIDNYIKDNCAYNCKYFILEKVK
ncbi:MAG: YutD-like domain-containing protein [Mycoplasmatota bacterium]